MFENVSMFSERLGMSTFVGAVPAPMARSTKSPFVGAMPPCQLFVLLQFASTLGEKL